MRDVRELTDGWEFTTDDVGLSDALSSPGADWDRVTLPHSWNAHDGHTGGNDYHRGPCWYRRAIDVGSLDGRRVYVEFGAAGTVADVHLGAEHVGRHRGGYSIFRCDVTDHLDADGRGVLTVRVDNSPQDDVYPLIGDHTVHGGLYRGARLVVVPALHVDLLDHGAPGVELEQRSLDDERGVLEVRTRIRNSGSAPAETELTVRVVDDSPVAHSARTVSVGAGEVVEVTTTLEVDHPRRWDGRHDPHVYRIVAELGPSGDRVELGFGFRTFEVDPERGVVLNGRPYRMYGVSRHHDFEGRGPALLPEHHDRDLALIEEIGATAVRLAHYQHDQHFYDLCDRAGLLVWAEIPLNARASESDPEGNAIEQLRELIAQCRHHPSVVCWGVQNEITLAEGQHDPRASVEVVHSLAKELDPSRPTAQANIGTANDDDPVHRIADLDAVNLYCGWYYEDRDDVGPALDAIHAANPGTPLGVSEYGADAHPDYHSESPVAGDYTEEYQSLLHESAWRAIEARPFVWASFVWNMFDFASDLRDEGAHAGRNMKGLVSYDRSVRKDAFHWYRANWSGVPMVHICSKRFVHRTEPEIVVRVYSNQPTVQLQVDGADAGPPTVDGRVFEWRVGITGAGTTVQATSGDQRDEATFALVEEADESYVAPPSNMVGRSGRHAPPNWWETDGVSVDHSIYSTWTPIRELVADPDARQVVVDLLGADALENEMFEMAMGFSLDRLAVFMPDGLTAEVLREAHRRLSAIPRQPR